MLGLKPTLRHLVGALAGLIEVQELTRISPLSHGDGGVWNVRATFPVLETLQIDFERQSELLPDPVSAAQFFAGLPSTLTALNVPPYLEINFWPLLPPSLTLLCGVDHNFPPSLDVAPNLTSILSLSGVGQGFHPIASTSLGSFWSANHGSTNAHLPPYLTSLETNLKLALPSSLTRLTYDNSGMGGNFFSLLKMLPPSLTSLKVIGSVIKSIAENLPILRHMKQFTLIGRLSSTSLFSAASIAILGCLPNLEELDIGLTGSFGMSQVSTGLDLEHLACLNARTLRSLTAEFQATCFNAAEDGTYPLDPFVKLHTLSTRNQTDFGHFTFAAIPASVTSLNLSRSAFTSETLHLIPASVTDLRGYLTIRPEDYPELCLSRSSSPSSTESMDAFDLSVEHSFDQVDKWAFFRRFKTQGSEVYDGVALEFKSFNTGLVLHFRDPPLIPSLTSITLHPRYDTKLMFNQSALPKLRHLRLPSFSSQSDDLDLGSCTSLRFLEIMLDKEEAEGVRCPPGLTKLYLLGSTLPDSFLPLPMSLTEIRAESFALLLELAHLDNLRTLECSYSFKLCERSSTDILTALSFLPKGLTSLSLPNETWENERAARALSLSLPALETIFFPTQTLSLTALDRLYRWFPDRVTFQASDLRLRVVPEEVPRLCNVPLGSILVPKGESLDFWYLPAINKTYPRLKGIYGAFWFGEGIHNDDDGSDNDDDDDGSDYDEESPSKNTSTMWSDFAPYLSPDNEDLILESSRIDLPPNFAKFLPRGLKTLEVNDNLEALTDAADLPPTLTKLDLNSTSLKLDDAGALPRSLTSLQFGQLLVPSSRGSPGSPEWPLGLIDMALYVNRSDRIFELLPTSLTRLEISASRGRPSGRECIQLTVELLKALPVGLKYYQDDDRHPWDEKMVSAALERNLTRLSRRWDLRDPFVDPIQVLDQALASIRKATH